MTIRESLPFPRTISTRPRALSTAVLLWGIAVAAGVIESVLAIADVLAAGDGGPGLYLQAAVRAVVYAGAAFLVHRLAHGRGFARPALTVLLGVIGLAAMVVPVISAMGDDAGAFDALGDGNGPLFVTARAVHIAAVVAATALMYTPAAGRWLSMNRVS